jgi:hypothetical protein
MIAKQYETAKAFRKALEDRLLKMAADEGADVQRLRRQLAFDRFLCRLSHGQSRDRHYGWVLVIASLRFGSRCGADVLIRLDCQLDAPNFSFPCASRDDVAYFDYIKNY